ncbi:YkvA family protein [Lewinella cohaerens]|uniref:YkvA family protein n=1 Tax=Lewinella cohaerens TaxID=70995 RepID=UPI0003637C8E|nr:YkvA family protein [Lewinella cohaerens]
MKKTIKKYQRYFSDERFWAKLKSQARNAGVKIVYSALLLFYAYRRKETPFYARSIILGVLGYFLAPIDLIPDLTPILGYTDDLGVLAFGLVTIAAYINQDVRQKARGRLHQWFGDYNEAELKEVDDQL